MELQLKKPICFFDLETTGTNVAKDRIVEISILKVFPNGNKESKTPLRVLFDPGSTRSYVYKQAIPHGAEFTSLKRSRVQVLHTHVSRTQGVMLSDIVFPEFSPTKPIQYALKIK